MALKDIVFKQNPTHEVEYEGHKIVFRGLTLRDTLESDLDLGALGAGDSDKVDLKPMLKTITSILASVIVSIDGQVPENRKETEEWLLSQSQSVTMDLFRLSNVFGESADTKKEEVKNL